VELAMTLRERPVEGRTAEWYTPPFIFERLGLAFDLDPCAPKGGVPWIPAARSFSVEDDGLAQPWKGRVWLNPPYGRETAVWMKRLANHGNGIALIFTRNCAKWFHESVESAHAICFVRGRLAFISSEDRDGDGHNSAAPSLLVAYGEDNARALDASGLGLVFWSWR
jgi:hypothetical protein